MTPSPVVVLQSDPQWLPERRGRLTASRMRDVLDFRKDGKEGAARRAYKVELVAERMADTAVERYVTPAMQRGLDLEPDARRDYETHTGRIVAPAGLVHHPRIDLWSATPDGFIDDDGLVEFKVPLLATYIDVLLAGVVPPDYVAQITAQLACAQREWCDFVAYCPELPQRRRFIRTVTPTKEEIANCEAAARQFLQEVDELFEMVVSSPEAA